MKYVLARGNAAVLSQLAWARVLLAFDFDGTLAPIVTRPGDAHMRKRTLGLLSKLCELYPCAVISGRSKSDVSARLGGAAVKYVIGNHGLEPGDGLACFEAHTAVARAALEMALSDVPGVEIEDKQYSLALHYRRSRAKRRARDSIRNAVSALPTPMRVVPGKLVVNVVPPHAPNKGDALVALRATEHADAALYVGDDVTDEDVFELDQPGRLLAIRVGRSRTSAAAYFLRRQPEIDQLLARLVSLRRERAAR